MEKMLDENVKLLAKDVGLTKSQVISDIIEFVMDNDEYLNELLSSGRWRRGSRGRIRG